MVSKRP
jgi:dCMP deaminase